MSVAQDKVIGYIGVKESWLVYAPSDALVVSSLSLESRIIGPVAVMLVILVIVIVIVVVFMVSMPWLSLALTKDRRVVVAVVVLLILALFGQFDGHLLRKMSPARR